MRLYSYITGLDDDDFCHRVTDRLNRGWELYGSPSLAFDAKLGRVICGQVVVKEVSGTAYKAGIDLASY